MYFVINWIVPVFPGLQRAAELPSPPRAQEVQPELRPDRNWDPTEHSPFGLLRDLLIIVFNVFYAFFLFFYRPERLMKWILNLTCEVSRDYFTLRDSPNRSQSVV